MALSLAWQEGLPPRLIHGVALVKGGGEIGTAVALGLWRAGWPVVVAELAQPTVLRRHLSLAEAAFAESVTRRGIRATRVTTAPATVTLLVESRTIPLYVGPVDALLRALEPALVVDARMRRGVAPERQRHEAPRVVGLGPDLVAGWHVDAVIETCPGPELGRVIREGSAAPYVPLGGRAAAAAERYVRAGRAGRWRTDLDIGSEVAAGDILGWLDGEGVPAPTAGIVRGLVHDDIAVAAGLKLAAVHPGDWARKETGIGWRAAAIAASVVALATDRPLAPGSFTEPDGVSARVRAG